jgi:hypothetical protein
MDPHVNGPAITPRGEVAPGAYYFYNRGRAEAVPLALVDIGDELWIALPGSRLRFTGWAVVSVSVGAKFPIEPGTVAPVSAHGKQWMVFERAPGDTLVLEIVELS